MNSLARSLVQRALHRLRQRPPAAAVAKNNKQQAAAGYSTTTDRLAAYRYRSDGGYQLLVPLVAVGAGTWLVATVITRYLMTPPRRRTTATTTTVEGPRPEVAASTASPSN